VEVFALGLKIKEQGAAAVKTAMDKMRASIKDTKTETDKLSKGFSAARLSILGAGAAITGGLIYGLAKMKSASVEAQFVQAQLAQTLQSTGASAWTSVEALNEHAQALQKVTTFGDEAINSAQSLLLTFKGISGPTFTRATESVLDLATAMGGDAKGAALQLGKALNDPVKGVAALSRSGVSFSQAQLGMIKSLSETNRLAEAQAIILKEVESQFGGSARAARQTLGGALTALNEAWGDLFEVSAESSKGIISVIENITSALPKMRDAFSDLILEWGVLLVDVELQLARLNKLVATSQGFFDALLVRASGGRLGVSALAEQAAVVAEAEADIHALEVLKAERQRELSDAAGSRRAPAAGTGTPTKRPPPPNVPTPEEVKEALDAVNAVIEQHYKDSADAFAFRSDQAEAQQAAVDAVVEQARADAVAAAQFQMDKMIEALEFEDGLRDALAAGVAAAVTAGFAQGIETALATGNIGEGFKALTAALLSGLGDSMIQFGVASLKLAELMDGLITAFANLIPGGAMARAVAMIALGSALKGAAGAAFGGRRSSGGGGGGFTPFGGISGSGGAGDPTVTRLIFGQTNAALAAGMTPAGVTHVTIIGPDDPTAQRAISELIAKGSRRGNL
jgi:hypothetical protein